MSWWKKVTGKCTAHKELKGSYTVEAAFIVPVLLGIAFSIMYVMFLFHDQTVLQGNLSYVLCSAAEKKEESENEKQRLSKGLWYFSVQDVSIKKKIGRVSGKVHCRGSLKIPVMEMFLNRIQSFTCSEEYITLQPEQAKVLKRKKKDSN